MEESLFYADSGALAIAQPEPAPAAVARMTGELTKTYG